ncbi:MAG TPA: DALR domain-containing protein, partial [Acidimicrobiales bacterium]|nr:DALR domain-containing protein [Acidimicrobiales bacterium]
SHYRSPIEVTADTVADAEKALERLDGLARRFSLPDLLSEAPDGVVVAGRPPATDVDPKALAEFTEAMDDDLDTPRALAGIFETVTRAHASADAGDTVTARVLAHGVGVLLAALGLPLRAATDPVDAETRRLADARDEARTARDWARADALRDELAARGWIVEDGPEGTLLRR